MSTRYFKEQFDDEEVLFMFRKHPVVMRVGLILGCLGPLIGILPAAINPNLGFGWFYGGLALGCLLGVLLFFPSWINWYYSIFLVTDMRFIQITQKGFFNKTFVDLGLNKIQSLNYEVRGIEATVLGYGTILIQTYMGDLTIHHIHYPAKIYKKLNEILLDNDIHPADASKNTGEL